MISLWISILCSVLIYLTFKLRVKFNANLKGMIVANYLTATLLGILIHPNAFHPQELITAEWFPIAALIGLLFVIMFFLIGVATNKTGIVLTTISTRMSMIIPILFSMLFFDEMISLPKMVKIVLTIAAVSLAIYRKPEKQIKPVYTLLPFILFIGSGSVDSLVKFAQHVYIPENQIELFSSSLFGISFLGAILLLFIEKNSNKLFTVNTLVSGIILGLFNFGSLYFFINALNKSGIESSLVFGINNLSIVCFSLMLGFFVFKEKLSRINWIGIAFSIICIIVLIRF